ncbi:ParB/RepB/Spo0J family partition protein [Kocuria sp.]|uniref:ParB/RepB/Spo0J family partition protein n=1 Tax=Kocuria sp. TaxID=1871328 RepID=UPI0026E02061|nr:ParB/RepB/Spo0J family partition protein [Kocuria sp.]
MNADRTDASESSASESVSLQGATASGDSQPSSEKAADAAGASGTKAKKKSKKKNSNTAAAQVVTPAAASTSDHGDSSVPAAEDAADVSRETPKTRKRTVTAEARQKAMKARMDLGVSTRSSAPKRPSDMFFTPSPQDEVRDGTAADAVPTPELTQETGDSDKQDNVSRETAVSPQVTETSADMTTVSAGENAVTAALESTPESNELPQKPAADQGPELQLVPGATFVELDVEDIHPNRKQPRQVFDEDELAELAYSIAELGVLQPVVVRPSRETDAPPYELVMGERRWRATQRAGLTHVPAIVRETSDDDLLRDALLENLHRSQLNPLEEAAAYQQLLEEFGASQEELSRRIGRSRPQISNTLRLLRLPALVQRRVAAGILSAGHARALLSLEDPAEMERLAQRIVAEGLSVRATEEAVTLSKNRKPTVRRSAATQERHRERLDYIADAYSDKLDTSVKINLGARKGRMTIEFASVEDLNRIISVLDPSGLPENQD